MVVTMMANVCEVLGQGLSDPNHFQYLSHFIPILLINLLLLFINLLLLFIPILLRKIIFKKWCARGHTVPERGLLPSAQVWQFDVVTKFH